MNGIVAVVIACSRVPSSRIEAQLKRPFVICSMSRRQSSDIERRSPTGRSLSGKPSEPARTHHSMAS